MEKNLHYFRRQTGFPEEWMNASESFAVVGSDVRVEMCNRNPTSENFYRIGGHAKRKLAEDFYSIRIAETLESLLNDCPYT